MTSTLDSAFNPAQRPVILVVDDESPNRALLRAYLDSSYELREATDGVSALEILKREPIDLVLLDVRMPRMTGFEVCRLIKQISGDEQYLPVILLTALGQQVDRNTGLDAGADDFLTKPIDRHELLARIKTFIRLRQMDARNRLQLIELGRREQVIHHQLGQLQALDRLKDEMVSLMVHDLRNPLGGIVGILDSLQRGADDQEVRADAHLALEASDLMRETLDDILRITRAGPSTGTRSGIT